MKGLLKQLSITLCCCVTIALLYGCGADTEEVTDPGSRFETFDTNGIYSVISKDARVMYLMDKRVSTLYKVNTSTGDMEVIASPIVGTGPSISNAVSFDYNAQQNLIVFLSEDESERAELITLDLSTGVRQVTHQFDSDYKLIGYISTPPVVNVQQAAGGQLVSYILLEQTESGAFEVLEVAGSKARVVFSHLDLPEDDFSFCLPLALAADFSSGSLFMAHAPCSNDAHILSRIDIATGAMSAVASRAHDGNPLWVISSAIYNADNQSVYMLSPNGRTLYQADLAAKAIRIVAAEDEKETHRGGAVHINDAGVPLVFDAYDWAFYSMNTEGRWEQNPSLKIIDY